MPKYVTATLVITATFYDDPDEPLTEAEIEDLAHSTSNWADWNLVDVSEVRRDG